MKREISLLDILDVLKRCLWLMVLAAVVVCVCVNLYFKQTYRQQYYTRLTMAITTYLPEEDVNNATATLNSVSYGIKMMNTYIEMLKMNSFYSNVINTYKENNNNETITKGEFAVITTTVENTNLFYYDIIGFDQDKLSRISEVIYQIAPDVGDTYVKDSLMIVDDGGFKASPYGSSQASRNGFIAAAIAAVVVFAVYFIVFLFDVRVKDEEEITKTYGIPLLGSIPSFDKVSSKSYYSKGYYGGGGNGSK